MLKKAYFQMHIAILLWGFTAILGKLIELDEGLLVWYRMLISSVTTAIYLYFSKNFAPFKLKDLPILLVASLTIVLHWITFYGAIKSSNVSIAISCFSSIAMFTCLLEPLVSKQKHKRSDLLLALGVMVGICIIFYVQELYLKGIILSVISALLASIFTVINKQLSNKFNSTSLTFYELGFGFLLLSVILPFYLNAKGIKFQSPTQNDLIYLIVLGVICTTIAFDLSLRALKKLDAFTLNLSVNLEPIYSIILAILLFQENKMLNLEFYIGTAIILAAVIFHGINKVHNRNKI